MTVLPQTFLQRLFYIICLLFEDITLLTCPITVITVITVIRTVAADWPVQAWPVQTEPERCSWCSSSFLSHIYVADTGFCGSDVLSGNTQVVDGMLQTVLDSAQFATAG